MERLYIDSLKSMRFFDCGSANITGGTSGGGGQPTPNAATLIVIKVVNCIDEVATCPPASAFTISVNAQNASPSTFAGSTTGTKVTLDSGTYNVFEPGVPSGFHPSFSADCTSQTSLIQAGEMRTCTVTNTQEIP